MVEHAINVRVYFLDPVSYPGWLSRDTPRPWLAVLVTPTSPMSPRLTRRGLFRLWSIGYGALRAKDNQASVFTPLDIHKTAIKKRRLSDNL